MLAIADDVNAKHVSKTKGERMMIMIMEESDTIKDKEEDVQDT